MRVSTNHDEKEVFVVEERALVPVAIREAATAALVRQETAGAAVTGALPLGANLEAAGGRLVRAPGLTAGTWLVLPGSLAAGTLVAAGFAP